MERELREGGEDWKGVWMGTRDIMSQAFRGHEYVFYEDGCTKGRASEQAHSQHLCIDTRNLSQVPSARHQLILAQIASSDISLCEP